MRGDNHHIMRAKTRRAVHGMVGIASVFTALAWALVWYCRQPYS